MASFQERLNEALSNSGLTQSELGRRAHIDRTVISGYIHGKYKAKQVNLYNLAKVLNVDEGWLMGVSDKKERRHPEEQVENTKKENGDITSEDIDHYFNGLRSYEGLQISDEQKAFMRNSIKSFLESQKAMHNKQNKKK
ncbi:MULTISPECIES: helix-turn-helix domain-containing protein [Lactobacillaceae]|uniref:Phage repressor n=1 Tax=Limosilactobacillus reuteri TaxID=1598 RepID=A0A0U5JUJ3_LIMRT|nr:MULTISPECIES: helix-turn-helix domain-containing protein [Lactobacillaceae]MCC4394816.1 helix-turn-helix domain-containing protein [Limosilactobacillus reuteri]MCC4402262.1 helix-turn-helix domain-containing protein [Limosilactobacillus reuteri]MCC4456440.1 helix-turn-helix domain-containing protein [Limosilactobacillus reuteri]MCC4465426.1 helix-turn-helix domain-containing protein [Limosilactobacillus reuteri]MCC4466895.1 helix-turn-helix domain-containing protein [Limosilactobacillus reu